MKALCVEVSVGGGLALFSRFFAQIGLFQFEKGGMNEWMMNVEEINLRSKLSNIKRSGLCRAMRNSLGLVRLLGNLGITIDPWGFVCDDHSGNKSDHVEITWPPLHVRDLKVVTSQREHAQEIDLWENSKA